MNGNMVEPEQKILLWGEILLPNLKVDQGARSWSRSLWSGEEQEEEEEAVLMEGSRGVKFSFFRTILMQFNPKGKSLSI